MKQMSVKDLLAYQRNKNIFVEGLENSGPAKMLKRFFNRFSSYYAGKSRVVVTARIIEYPILFQYLRHGRLKILDFGCVEDMLPIHLASLGYEVTGMDFRPYPFEHHDFTFIQADILQWDPPVEEFDTIVSISTIEHVGLSAYGDPVCEDGDKVAVRKLWQALKPGGELIITVPAGSKRTARGMRIYDDAAVRELVPDVETLRYFHKPARYEMWTETDAQAISSLEYENYNTLAPAQGIAIVVGRKK